MLIKKSESYLAIQTELPFHSAEKRDLGKEIGKELREQLSKREVSTRLQKGEGRGEEARAVRALCKILSG